LQVTVEKLGPCQARVSFTVPSDEFQGALRKALGEAGRNVRMKGFRPGHVPPQVIERQFGKEIRRGTLEDFLRKAFQKAVDENQLKVVGSPTVDLEKLNPIEGGDFSHEFEVSLRPDIALQEYKALSIESELEPVVEQEIDAALENFKAQQAHPEPAGDVGLPENGLALVKVEWLAGSDVVLSRDGLRIGPDAPTPGCDPEAFKTAVLGAKDGDVREIPMTFPEDFEREDLRGKQGTTRLAIAQAYRMVAPTDDEVRKFFDAKDDADLRAKVKEKIEEAKIAQEQSRIESTLLNKLIDAHAFDLPEKLLENQTEGRLLELSREMEAAGTPKDKIPEQVEGQREAAKTAAARGLRALFLVQTIAEKENLLVSREDMRAELESIAKRNQATVEEVAEYYKKQNLYDQMAIEILERKVRRFLRENAQITEPK
jgi:trigger factor